MRVIVLLVLLALFNFVRSLDGSEESDAGLRVAAVIFACSRPSHLRKTLRSFALQDGSIRKKVAVYVSIDSHRRAKHVHRAAEDEALSLDITVSGIWQHSAPEPDTLDARARIARHYYLGLSKLFSSRPPPSHAIILEDDLDFAPDFLSFLLAFASRTSADPSRGPAAISGWNDNGASHTTPGTGDVHLTSLFPGLGWLLPRSVWLQLEPHWPCHCARSTTMSSSHTVRVFPLAPAAPAGWDWWLRAEFQARGWSTLYPLLARVSHRGAAGANVVPGQQRAVFERVRSAGEKEALSPAAWAAVADKAQAVHAPDFRAWLDMRETDARPIQALSDIPPDALVPGDGAASSGDGLCYRLHFNERQFPAIARRLQLWPHPRGFFEGRLALPLNGGGALLLVRNAARAELGGAVEPILAGVNVSCSEACAGGSGRECSVQGIAELNFCKIMAEKFGCQNGCVFETGADIPAVVEQGAPLETRGACVVTEDAAAIDCGGRFQHTRRVCVCDGSGERGADGSRDDGPKAARAKSGVWRGVGDVNGRNKEEL